jgi:ABC-2 type transport system permease protein
MKALTVARKEIADQMNSNKFLIVFGLMLLLTAATSFQGAKTYQDSMDRFQESQNSETQMPAKYAPEKPSVLDAFNTLTRGINFPLVGGLLALILSFNTVSGERDRNTLKLLTSYPLHRDSIINGKFIAGIFTLTLASAASFLAASGIIISMTGATVTAAAATRILLMLGGTVLYMSVIYGLGTLLSTVFDNSSDALMGGILALITFSLIVPQMAFFVSDLFVQEQDDGIREPGEGLSDSFEKRMDIQSTIRKATPSGSYSHFMSYMLGQDPSQVTVGSSSGPESDPTITESLNSSLGVLGLLFGELVVLFGGSYILFTRQEI